MPINCQRIYGYRTFSYVLITGVLLAAAPLTTNAATSYLQELEAEAKRDAAFEDEVNKQPPAPEVNENTPSIPATSGAPGSGETIDSGLTQAQFEQKLKDTYYGSYLFYSTLDAKQQGNVYQDYKRNNSIDSIRESIKANMKN